MLLSREYTVYSVYPRYTICCPGPVTRVAMSVRVQQKTICSQKIAGLSQEKVCCHRLYLLSRSNMVSQTRKWTQSRGMQQMSQSESLQESKSFADNCGWLWMANCWKLRRRRQIRRQENFYDIFIPLDWGTLNNKAANLSQPQPKSVNPEVKSEFNFLFKSIVKRFKGKLFLNAIID